jgi:drug/metabolite transporter (DMT)-like permease
MDSSSRFSPLGKGLIALMLFGSVPCTVRFIALDSIAIGIVRLGLSAIGLGVLLLGTKKLVQMSAREWRLTALAGLAFGFHWLFYFLGIKLSSASMGALGFSTYGVQLIVLGWVLRLNPVRVTDLVGVGLAVFGSVLVIPEFSLESKYTLGLLSGILSGTFYAVLPIIHQKNKSVPDDLRAWGQFAFAFLVFLPLLSYAQWEASLFEWGLAVYLALVVTLIGHTLWVHASTALPTTTTSIISYLYLPTAIHLGWSLLGEELTLQMLLGAACILIGNVVGLYAGRSGS